MLGSEGRVIAPGAAARLSDDLEVPDAGVLDEFIGSERCLVHAFGIPLDALDGLKDMTEVIGYAEAPFRAHTGTASLTTTARNFTGKSSGVRTLTLTPSRSISSARIAPRSNS